MTRITSPKLSRVRTAAIMAQVYALPGRLPRRTQSLVRATESASHDSKAKETGVEVVARELEHLTLVVVQRLLEQ
jgi:hypothetical protein